MKPSNYAHINISHKKGYWYKIGMEFLRPLLAKIELICQQLAIPQLSGVEGVASQPWGAGQDGWGLMGWSGYGIRQLAYIAKLTLINRQDILLEYSMEQEEFIAWKLFKSVKQNLCDPPSKHSAILHFHRKNDQF